jgi:hypothetical protein
LPAGTLAVEIIDIQDAADGIVRRRQLSAFPAVLAIPAGVGYVASAIAALKAGAAAGAAKAGLAAGAAKAGAAAGAAKAGAAAGAAAGSAKAGLAAGAAKAGSATSAAASSSAALTGAAAALVNEIVLGSTEVAIEENPLGRLYVVADDKISGIDGAKSTVEKSAENTFDVVFDAIRAKTPFDGMNIKRWGLPLIETSIGTITHAIPYATLVALRSFPAIDCLKLIDLLFKPTIADAISVAASAAEFYGDYARIMFHPKKTPKEKAAEVRQLIDSTVEGFVNDEFLSRWIEEGFAEDVYKCLGNFAYTAFAQAFKWASAGKDVASLATSIYTPKPAAAGQPPPPPRGVRGRGLAAREACAPISSPAKP